MKRNYSKPRKRGVVCASGVPGAATSASKVARVVGVRIRGDLVWIEGEGWVKWTEIERDVREKFELWRNRKAQQGVLIRDGVEKIHADMAEAVERKNKRAALRAAA